MGGTFMKNDRVCLLVQGYLFKMCFFFNAENEKSYTLALALEESDDIYKHAIDVVYDGPCLHLNASLKTVLDLLKLKKFSNDFKSFTKSATELLWNTMITTGKNKIPHSVGFEHMNSSFHMILMDGSLENQFQKCVKLEDSAIPEEQICLIFPDILMAMLEEIFKKRLGRPIPTISTTCDLPPMSKAEEQTIHYVAGFVAYKFKKHFAKFPESALAETSRLIVSSWVNNHSLSDEPSSFMGYLNLWLPEVKRGRLFQVRDDVIRLFRNMETICKSNLKVSDIQNGADTIQNGADTIQNGADTQTALFKAIESSFDFNMAWDITTRNVEGNIVNRALMELVITMYVNIRCKSFSRVSLRLQDEINKIAEETDERPPPKKRAK